MKKVSLLVLFVSVSAITYAQAKINLVGKLAYTGLPLHDVWGYTDSLGNDYALLCASTSGMKIIDVSDPTIPVEIASISGNGVDPVDVKTWKNYAYTSAEDRNSPGVIIDLINPASPKVVGSFPGGHNITISDSGYMFVSSPGLRIFNLNIDPSIPSLVFTDNSCDGHDISIVGQTLYDFSWNCGTRIYDLSRPDTLVHLGTVPASGQNHHSGWPSQDGRYLYICDELAKPTEKDIMTWDVSNPKSPKLVGGFSDPNAFVHNLYVVENYAYVSYYRAGFRVFNVQNPEKISLEAEYDTDSVLSGTGFEGNFGVFVFWGTNKILISDEKKGLYIFSVSGLTSGINGQKFDVNSRFVVYPNPSNGNSIIEYSLGQPSNVHIDILNSLGCVIRSYSENIVDDKIHKIYLSEQDLKPDVYFVRISTMGMAQTIRMIVTRPY